MMVNVGASPAVWRRAWQSGEAGGTCLSRCQTACVDGKRLRSILVSPKPNILVHLLSHPSTCATQHPRHLVHVPEYDVEIEDCECLAPRVGVVPNMQHSEIYLMHVACLLCERTRG